MIIDCISDLHGEYPELRGGDLLILAGDYTGSGAYVQWDDFFSWLEQQSYRKKVLIAGNHDNYLMNALPWTRYLDDADDLFPRKHDFEYLCDSGTEFGGLKIWGSPWTKTFKGMNPHCMYFTCDTDDELEEYWNLIPDDTDILITHSPPHKTYDEVIRKKEHVGSPSLRRHVMSRIKPKLHVFGHIHEWGGCTIDSNVTLFVNASIMNEVYDPVNKSVRAHYDGSRILL